MADVWTFSAANDRFTLTMDGTGSGQNSRSKAFSGLTANGQYTFYQTQNPSTSLVGSFLEIDGGDRTSASGTGSQTVGVTGDADGSGNITLRFGVADSAGAAATAASDTLQYLTQAAAEAAGWTVTSAWSGAGVTFDSGHAIAGSGLSTSVVYTVNGIPSSSGTLEISKTYNVGAGTVVSGRLWAEGNGSQWEFLTLRIQNTAGTSKSASNKGNEGVEHLQTANLTAGGDGLVTVRIFMGAIFPSNHNNATWHFSGMTLEGAGAAATATYDKITFCSGTGVSTNPGTGAGDPDDPDDPTAPGNEPVPDPPPGGYPPPPVGGTRPFGIYTLPAEGGIGYWNSTVKQLSVSNAVNLLNSSATGDMMNLFTFGATRDFLDSSGKFSFLIWKARVDACYNNVTIRNRISTAITAGNFWAHIFDEPYHPTRYGGPIPFATVERICQYLKSLWPTMRVIIRTDGGESTADRAWFVRHMNGCDGVWGEYILKFGDPARFRDQVIAWAASLGHGVVMGLHYKAFDRYSGTRIITPSELRHYGGILWDTASATVIAAHGWKWTSAMYSQPGFQDANRYTRDLFASHD